MAADIVDPTKACDIDTEKVARDSLPHSASRPGNSRHVFCGDRAGVQAIFPPLQRGGWGGGSRRTRHLDRVSSGLENCPSCGRGCCGRDFR